MRDLTELDSYRVKANWVLQAYGSFGDDTCGAFAVPSPVDAQALRIIASNDLGWDHVSVSRVKRVPNWAEMDHVKRMFFKPHEVVMQLHVPEDRHINCHPNCLHLWRPHDVTIPTPPDWMVGPKEK